MQENLSGVRVVRAFSRNAFERDRFHDANSTLMENNIGAVRSTVIALPAMMISTTFGMVAAIWFGGHRVNNGQMQIGELIAFITYLTQALLGLMFLSQLVVSISTAAIPRFPAACASSSASCKLFGWSRRGIQGAGRRTNHRCRNT